MEPFSLAPAATSGLYSRADSTWTGNVLMSANGKTW